LAILLEKRGEMQDVGDVRSLSNCLLRGKKVKRTGGLSICCETFPAPHEGRRGRMRPSAVIRAA
jgi:hypothetical protein